MFLDRRRVPVHQNLLLDSAEAARGVTCGDLRMAFCAGCGFVYNESFDERLLRYDAAYDNTQTASPLFESYTNRLAEGLVASEGGGAVARRVIEVGCGKGAFLLKLLNLAPAWNGVGYDPTYIGEASRLGGRFRVERKFFGPETANAAAELIVCRHVIEHIARPVEFLMQIAEAVQTHQSARLYFETPDVRWILTNTVVWDFFYEHCSLFAPMAAAHALTRSGLRTDQIVPVFGNQYMWITAGTGAASNKRPLAFETVSRSVVEVYSEAVRHRLQFWSAEVERAARRGTVMLWGGGAKGATFAYLVDPNRSIIDSVVDIARDKHGKFVPGTGHPIVSPDRLTHAQNLTVLVLNPNYTSEIAAMLSQINPEARLIDLMRQGDCA